MGALAGKRYPRGIHSTQTSQMHYRVAMICECEMY
ncbi:hypothetical protein P3T22_000638 [Paraburkholderia sp. GAS348]